MSIQHSKYYLLMETPTESWKPRYKDPELEDLYDSETVSNSIEYFAHPEKMDYLILSSNGRVFVKRPASEISFDDIYFDKLPPFQELLAKGTVLEVPELLAQVHISLQDEMWDLQLNISGDTGCMAMLEEQMNEKRFGFPTKDAREARREYKRLAAGVERMKERYSQAETFMNTSVLKRLAALEDPRESAVSLDQQISQANEAFKQSPETYRNRTGLSDRSENVHPAR